MSGFAGDSADELRLRLKRLGLSEPAIRAAWPRWWSEDADGSPSARAELRFGVARRLGLDPRSLLADAAEPRFMWREEARFKNLSNESELERAGITSFGRSVATTLLRFSPDEIDVASTPATALREQILGSGRPYVDLLDLLSLAWTVGVPVIHLQVFPWPQKRMAAMTVRIEGRSAILLAKESNYPAPIAFYLGHELGHIALGHVEANRSIVDLEDEHVGADGGDEEETAADQFALELLTGQPQPRVLPEDASSAKELARVAVSAAASLQIEPGTLAQCFGYSTRKWKTANAALKLIYGAGKPVSGAINAVAWSQLNLEDAPAEAVEFLGAVLGRAAE